MRILIAPDKFKGTLSAREVAENIAAGLREVFPDAKVDIVPMADGGEGTAEVISQALGGSWLTCKAHDPLGREIEARYAWVDVSDRSRVPLRADDRALFDDPERADDPRTVAVADRFLGLELARLLMEANGGSLDIESPSTLGSLVRLRLPRATRPPLMRSATA